MARVYFLCAGWRLIGVRRFVALFLQELDVAFAASKVRGKLQVSFRPVRVNPALGDRVPKRPVAITQLYVSRWLQRHFSVHCSHDCFGAVASLSSTHNFLVYVKRFI